MFNKLQPFVQRLNRSVEYARLLYRDFRIYDVGSYALNRLTPRKGYSVQENVAYGLRARHRLDLFCTQTPREHRPLIVFVHGGAWMHGDKKDYRFIGEAFAKEGFDVAVINYHLAPEHIFPASIDDLSLALNYLNVHQLKYQISTEKVVLMGHSAGAFNVMSALYHPKPYEIQCRSQITAIIGLAGPYHFDYKGDPICADAFDQNRPNQEVMPYYFVESNTGKH
ncbi:MAG: alpha/beta hydrolase, partial [Pseudomonadales bacterium]|nr:alpha/beta hydrolase [Pseudomonadales bacterium]